MGQECSLPCTATRKDQVKKMAESKYDFKFLDTMPDEQITDLEKSKKFENGTQIDECLAENETDSSPIKKFMKADLSVIDPHISQTGSIASLPSMRDYQPQELTVMVTCEEIYNFEEFVDSFQQEHGKNFVPILVTPHPFLKKAVVVLQNKETLLNHNSENKMKFLDYEKDLKNMANKTSYQLLIPFIKQCGDRGLDYLGYYLDLELKYHFVFCEKQNVSKEDSRLNLDFHTFEDLCQSEVDQVLAEVTTTDYKLKGVVTLIPTEMTPKPISFAIFDQKNTEPPQYITVDIAAEAIGRGGVSQDLSRKVEIGCKSDDLNLACVITNHQERTLYLTFINK